MPLFAMIPARIPMIRAVPQTIVSP